MIKGTPVPQRAFLTGVRHRAACAFSIQAHAAEQQWHRREQPLRRFQPSVPASDTDWRPKLDIKTDRLD